MRDTGPTRSCFTELNDTDSAVSNDLRWSLFEQALRADARWECAYAIDLTDVRMLALPPYQDGHRHR